MKTTVLHSPYTRESVSLSGMSDEGTSLRDLVNEFHILEINPNFAEVIVLGSRTTTERLR